MNAHRYSGPLRRESGERKRAYALVRAARDMPIAERIKLHVEIDEASGCWVWQLALVPGTGYGSLSFAGKVLRAHRASYEAFVGPIPRGLHIDHLCRNRACVNPEHLEPVTCAENVRRGMSPGVRAVECPYGHPYDEVNTYRHERTNRRHCRTCRVVYLALYRTLTPQERAARKDAGLPVVDLAAHFAELGRAA